MFLAMKVAPLATLMAGLLFAVACGSTRIADGNQRVMGRSSAVPLLEGWPHVIVWAWQRPEDLSFFRLRRNVCNWLTSVRRRII